MRPSASVKPLNAGHWIASSPVDDQPPIERAGHAEHERRVEECRADHAARL